MSGRLVREVLENAPASLRPLELMVLVSLAESAGDKTRTTYGAQAAATVIAHRVRATQGSVRNALSALTTRGLIKPIYEKARRGLAQNYHLTELHEWHRNT